MKTTNVAGTAIRLSEKGQSQRSMIGASQSAIRKPITTDGTVAMISTTGLIVRRKPGVVK